MKKEARIDIRRESSQDPVGKVKSVLEQLREQKIKVSKIEIIGDCEIALGVVENFLINQGYIFETRGSGNEFSIIVKSKEEVNIEALEDKPAVLVPKVFFFKDDKMGEGALGKKLLEDFLAQLCGILPEKIICVNKAVLLAQNECAKSLQSMERKGVEILLCKTCVDHYAITEQILAGKISNAQEIGEVLLGDLPIVSF